MVTAFELTNCWPAARCELMDCWPAARCSKLLNGGGSPAACSGGWTCVLCRSVCASLGLGVLAALYRHGRSVL